MATGTRIGAQMTILDGVTFVMDGVDHTARAVVGDRVYIRTNAVIVGGVAIGDDASIGAGAVVTHDVHARTAVGGVPATVIGEGHHYAHRGGDPDGGRAREIAAAPTFGR